MVLFWGEGTTQKRKKEVEAGTNVITCFEYITKKERVWTFYGVLHFLIHSDIPEIVPTPGKKHTYPIKDFES